MQAKKYFLKSQNFFEKIIEFKNSFKIEMLVPGTSSRKVLGIMPGQSTRPGISHISQNGGLKESGSSIFLTLVQPVL